MKSAKIVTGGIQPGLGWGDVLFLQVTEVYFNYPENQNLMKRLMSLLVPLCFLSIPLNAQLEKSESDSTGNLHIYIDCSSCDMSYLAENLSVGSMVNDPVNADAHVLFSEMSQAGGSGTSSIIFVGKNRFEALQDTLEFNVPPEASPDEKRNLQIQMLRMGLVPYLMKTPEAGRLFLFIDEDQQEQAVKKDPWNNWMFDIMGMGSFSNQKSYSSKNMNLTLSVSRITKKLKIESLSHFIYNTSTLTYFDLDSNEHNITTRISGLSSNSLLVKSLGKHFGIGGTVSIVNDQSNNLRLQYGIGPAVEYNVFEYEKALQKQFRILYSLVYEQSEYVAPSIYNKMNDRMWRQSLHIISQFNQP